MAEEEEGVVGWAEENSGKGTREGAGGGVVEEESACSPSGRALGTGLGEEEDGTEEGGGEEGGDEGEVETWRG